MKKSSILLKRAIVLALMIGGIFSSCKKDDTPVEPPVDEKLPSVEVPNAQLKAALVRKGFTFDEQGFLVKNDSVLDLTVLDLADCELSDASGLEVFPKLEEVNLAGNKFFYSFDFSVLPASVTRANLTGNEIYEFPGLLTVVTEENGDETVSLLRPLTKLHLPYSARYNCSELVYLYEQLKSKIDSGDAEIKIENEDNQITAYNTLREVPNDITRARLKQFYPLFFEGDYIDIAKRVTDVSARTVAMTFARTNTSVDGAQYILHHRDFKGASVVLMVWSGDEHTVIPYLKVPPHLNQLQLEHVDTPNGIDCSKAENLYRILVYNNRGLKTLDLSASKLFGQRDVMVEYLATTGSTIDFEACADLEEIVFPEAATGVNLFYVHDLPALKTLNLSRFETIWHINMMRLPENMPIVYPELKKWVYGATFNDDLGSTKLSVRSDIAHRTETKNFIKTYRTHLDSGSAKPLSSRIAYDQNSDEDAYVWRDDKDLLDNL
ncbi:MAG: leucine-rich repeat domain-containing protein [Prevotellaceae bacterium]|jgi:hypothetical protein|nr:leucine-rich repeat domain-containing protein [Prevotellaceae bacterium]